ncbi:MAG TPA: flagellar basal body rod protein FlgC [Firmicutes bacterium]|nr:flagellar basal body rod protein FlgC [Candidatus Fermentithermobacillaceae bacterium]
MNLFSSIEASASGLTAQRLRLDLIASNLANAETTRTEGGGPYRRKVAIFAPRDQQFSFRNIFANKLNGSPEGVRVVAVVEDTSPPRRVYMPTHPDADQDGYVTFPNVDVVTEMVDMMAATRAYEANVTAIEAAKSMMQKALEMLRV